MPDRQRPPGTARLSVRVYTVDPATGTTTPLKPAREYLSGWRITTPPPAAPFPPCACPRCGPA